jgi:hypothetical protein
MGSCEVCFCNASGLGIDIRVHEFKIGVNYQWLPGTLFGRW